MAFYFPKDEELFEDLENIGERSEDLDQLLRLMRGAERARSADKLKELCGDTLGEKGFGDVEQAEKELGSFATQLCVKYYDGDSDAFFDDMRHGKELFDDNAFGVKFWGVKRPDSLEENYMEKFYLRHEACAADAASTVKIGWFPGTLTVMYSDLDWGMGMKFSHYFGEMDKHFAFMKGVGKVGTVLKKAKSKLVAIEKAEEACKAKVEKASVLPLYFLLVGAGLLLCGGAALPVVPDFLSVLLNNSLLLRLIVLALTVITALLVMGMTKFLMEKDSGVGLLMKLVGNGIVTMLVSIGAVLVALSSIGEIEPFSLLPFGVYFLLYGVCFMLEDAADRKKRKKALAEAKREAEAQKSEFRKLVEENIQYLHRYIRFHVLWYKSVHKKEDNLPAGITALQKSFDHLLKKYQQYS